VVSFKYFSRDEFKCSETGNNEIQDEFIHALDQLRESCGFPFAITSGYRDPSHSVEAKKEKAGQHTLGIAADIAVSGGSQRFIIVSKAMELGFSGIGVARTFVHVDIRTSQPVLWCY
jgi:zinc D-Ala-D-Ala carboxypeptidase